MVFSFVSFTTTDGLTCVQRWSQQEWISRLGCADGSVEKHLQGQHGIETFSVVRSPLSYPISDPVRLHIRLRCQCCGCQALFCPLLCSSLPYRPSQYYFQVPRLHKHHPGSWHLPRSFLSAHDLDYHVGHLPAYTLFLGSVYGSNIRKVYQYE